MHFENKIAHFIVFVTAFREVIGGVPMFRVLAPEFVCPNDKDAAIDKPDNTIITVKTDVAELQLRWTVRWVHLERPSQRFTLLLWKTVRALETRLNAPQPEPFVYVIDNTDLLQGVEYVFNVTALDPDSDNSTTKTFSIDNIKGDPTLLIDGRSEKLSVLLVGEDSVYADMEYVIEAVVTTCSPTQDYYFAWSVQNSFASPLSDLDTSGSRLEIPPYSLQAGASCYVSCTVYRNSGELVTKKVIVHLQSKPAGHVLLQGHTERTGLPLQVLYRELAVSLYFDVLVVTANNGFDIGALVENQDHYGEELNFEWCCVYETRPCKHFKSINSEKISIPRGLTQYGRYEITLIASVNDQEASSNAAIIVIEPNLPVIQIEPQHRLVHENSVLTLVANVSDVVPSCTLTWYFASEEYLTSLDSNACDDCLHGEELSGSITITSLEENFLNELADFTNETEFRQVVAQVNASTGRARFVARCGCSLTFNCDSQGIVYADVNLTLNESPKVAEIKVSPETGTAMETVFRIITLAASDPDKPLRYSFYCSLSAGGTLMLASNLEYLATETFLPFIGDSGTEIWVEVCDSLGACSSSEVRTVQVLEGEGRTVQALVDSMRGYLRRCEMMALRRVVQSSVSTYTNANQKEILSKFTKALLETLPTTENHCFKNNQDYLKLLDWLRQVGVYLSA